MTEIDPLDSKIFWTGLYGVPVVWSLFLLIGTTSIEIRTNAELLDVALLKFNIDWALIAGICIFRCMFHVYGASESTQS
jgi:hypothetical protein